jgi:ankyrin repeat protein
LTRIPAIFKKRLSSEWQNRQFFFPHRFVEVAVIPYLTMASASAATTTKQQANTYLVEPTTSDDETQVMAATSVVTTQQQPMFDLVEPTKSDEEAKAAAGPLEAKTNHQANLDLIEAPKSDGRAKPITATPVPTTNEQANLDLLEAAESNDEAKAVAALTQSDVDVNCRDDTDLKFTPFIRASRESSMKVVRVLLADPRVDVNATDTLGLTALHHAHAKSLGAIILSESKDIEWNPTHKAGGTPLHFKSRIMDVDAISELIRVKSVDLLARSIDGFTALHELAERESPFPDWFRNKPTSETSCKLIDILLAEHERRGHDLVTFVNATDVLNRTALHYIAEEGSVEMLKRLLERCPTGMSVTGVDCHGFAPILLAVRRGHPGMVELLLRMPSMDANVAATVNTSTPSGLKPWESDHLNLCRANLFSKAPKEVPPADNLTPLHFAAMDGHAEIVDLLLKWPGMHVAPLDTKGLSPFHYSIQNGHSGVVKLLLEKLKNIGTPFTFCDEWLAPLDHSIQKGHLEVVKLLVEESKPFTRLNCQEQMSMFENLLHVATEHNKKEIAVHLLYTLGLRTRPFAQTSTPSSNHQSQLLAIAARDNYSKIIRYVLKWHPDVDPNAIIQLVAEQDLVAPPLHFAALGGHVEAVRELLLHHDLDVNAKDNKNRTPLLWAIKEDKLGVVKALCFGDPGNHIRATKEYKDGRTPIQIATEANLKEIEKVLLEQPEVKDFVDRLYRDRQVFVHAANALLVGAALIASVTFAGWLQPPLGYIPDYNFSQPFPAPPLHFAALGGHVEAVKELLLHHDLDVNAKDNKNRTPLLCAIKEDKLGVVKALCSDPLNRMRATEEPSDGRTPIQIATEADMKEIEKVLLERPEVKDFVDRLYRDRQVFVDAANALLVGAALIASVTFAGWLQPPLGYIPDYDFSQPFPAPPQTPESYAAVKNHANVKAFWVFNSLSFFLAIATVLAGADAALPNLQDEFIGRRVKSVERALIRATILLVISVVCVLGAFASAGFAVLPPLLKYDTSMIITVCLGGTICILTLAKIIWKLSTPIRMRFLKTSTTMTAGGHATGLP